MNSIAAHRWHSFANSVLFKSRREISMHMLKSVVFDNAISAIKTFTLDHMLSTFRNAEEWQIRIWLCPAEESAKRWDQASSPNALLFRNPECWYALTYLDTLLLFQITIKNESNDSTLLLKLKTFPCQVFSLLLKQASKTLVFP